MALFYIDVPMYVFSICTAKSKKKRFTPINKMLKIIYFKELKNFVIFSLSDGRGALTSTILPCGSIKINSGMVLTT